MNAFQFTSPLLPVPVLIQQASSGEIGFKLYPGALLLCQWLEENSKTSLALCPGMRILELGAGICALPSFLAAVAGCHCVVTDVPNVLPLLSSNIEANRRLLGVPTAQLQAHPLFWGSSAAAAPTPASETMLLPGSTAMHPSSVDLILGADIVYHEHLISPLLETLVKLTDPDICGGRSPPKVVLSYVQRFKRAKAFFKRAEKWFDVVMEPVQGGGAVVDYEVLTWHLPRLEAMLRQATTPELKDAVVSNLGSSACLYSSFLRVLRRAAAAFLEGGPDALSSPSSHHSPATAAEPTKVAGAVAKPAEGTVEGPTWRRRASTGSSSSGADDLSTPFVSLCATELFLGRKVCGAPAPVAAAVSAGFEGAPTKQDIKEAETLCLKLGLPVIQPSKGYICTLTRRPPGAARGSRRDAHKAAGCAAKTAL